MKTFVQSDWELIMPVGTSLLRWLNGQPHVEVKIPKAWSPFSLNIACEGATPTPELRVAQTLNQALDAERTCAEIDSTRKWLQWTEIESGRAPASLKRITLLASDTDVGRWVTNILERILPRALNLGSVEVEPVVVEQVARASMQRGLRSFVREVGQRTRTAQNLGRQVAINATAGFKVESAFGTLLGATLGAEIFYLHETMKDVVVLPPMPLTWDLDSEDLALLARIDREQPDDARVNEMGSSRKAALLWPFLDSIPIRSDDDPDRAWAPSPLGELVLQSHPGASATVELTERTGEVDKNFKANEEGHTPPAAHRWADEFGEVFPFVQRVVFRGWPGGSRGRTGLQRPGPDDEKEGRVRIRVRSDGDLRLSYDLYTTARSPEEWQAARDRVGERYGRLSLHEELGEARGEQAQDGTAAFPDLSHLHLVDQMQVHMAQVEAEAAQTTAQREGLERQLQNLDRRFQQAARDRKGLQNKNREARQEIQNLQEQRNQAMERAQAAEAQVRELQTALDARTDQAAPSTATDCEAATNKVPMDDSNP